MNPAQNIAALPHEAAPGPRALAWRRLHDHPEQPVGQRDGINRADAPVIDALRQRRPAVRGGNDAAAGRGNASSSGKGLRRERTASNAELLERLSI